MRIWYQSSLELDRVSEYPCALLQHCERVADPGTSVEFFGVPPGTWGGQQAAHLLGYPLAFHALLSHAFIGNTLRAEREGYDVYVIGTYVEPFLREVRSAVNIPVVSSFEAMLLVACSIGHTIGIVTLNRDLAWIHQARIEAHKLGGRIGPVLAVEPELSEQELTGLLAAPDDYLERFRHTVRRAVQEGADVIVPSEGLVAIVAARAGLSEVDGATVMDGIGVPVAYAEMFAKLWSRTGLRTARRQHYARPPGPTLDFLTERILGHRPG